MKIVAPSLFYFSLTSLILSIITSYEFSRTIESTVTRDFNFSEPLVYTLIFTQASVSIIGIITSIKPLKFK